VPVIVFSFADPRPWLGRAKNAGALTVCQVQSLELAQLAVDAGADVLLTQGNEAGGHTGEINLLPLLVALVERYPNVPVLAAGGITSGRALAGALAASAEGASLGTALLATPEAVEVPQAFKEQIVLSDGQDTAFTRLYDLLGIRPWPEGIVGRVYRNRLVREWHGRDAEVLARREELASDVAARTPASLRSTWARERATSTPSARRGTWCGTSAGQPRIFCKDCRKSSTCGINRLFPPPRE
jgi:nitronate monooxygenase